MTNMKCFTLVLSIHTLGRFNSRSLSRCLFNIIVTDLLVISVPYDYVLHYFSLLITISELPIIISCCFFCCLFLRFTD
jgi:hypothetical protein